MLLFHGFAYSEFERPNGARYSKFNIFSLPASSKEEARSMMLMENGLAIKTITDKLHNVECDAKEVSADDLAIVMWAAVDANREMFLRDVVSRLMTMGMEADTIREIVEEGI